MRGRPTHPRVLHAGLVPRRKAAASEAARWVRPAQTADPGPKVPRVCKFSVNFDLAVNPRSVAIRFTWAGAGAIRSCCGRRVTGGFPLSIELSRDDDWPL